MTKEGCYLFVAKTVSWGGGGGSMVGGWVGGKKKKELVTGL